MQNIILEGFVHLNNGDLDRARDTFQLVLNIDAKDIGASSGMAAVNHHKQNFTSALSYSEVALEGNPRDAELHVHHAQYLLSAGRIDAAQFHMNKAAAYGKRLPGTLYNLGVIYSEMSNFRQAKKYLLRASKLNQDDPVTLMMLANVYAKSGDASLALKTLKHCQELVAGSSELSYQLGTLYFQTGNFPNAEINFEHSLKFDSQNIEACLSLSAAHLKLGKVDSAISACKMALKISPNSCNAHYNIAKYYGLKKNLREALKHSKRAYELDPTDSDAGASYFQFCRQACTWGDIDKLSTELDKFIYADVLNPTKEPPFINIFRTTNLEINFEVAKMRSTKISTGISQNKFSKYFERRRNKTISSGIQGPIKIGYISNDFRDHPTGHLMQHFFGLHNNDKFHVSAYSHGPNDQSPYRQTIERECDKFLDARELSDLAVARCISNDGIDILIDLNVHITGERMAICAQRPAPIQVSMLAYPGTSGADYYDYLVTDEIVTPQEDKAYFSEKFITLPGTYFVTNPRSEISDRVYSRAECGLPANINDGAVFACFNNSYKIEPFIFEAWLEILEKCPGSVLWLFSHNELCQKNLLSLAIERGISGERLIFAEDLPKPEHLARLSIADLALDTGIYGGHTTTADNLLVGVPTIAIEGSHFASRASNSILCALGLAELVCPDLTAYKVLAQHLALDVNALATLKEKIKINKNIYPLFDAKFYMKNFENNLEKIFAMWLRGHDLDHVGND